AEDYPSDDSQHVVLPRNQTTTQTAPFLQRLDPVGLDRGFKSSFWTRQLDVSAAYTSFSEGQASWWIPENCLSCRPDPPMTPNTLPSSESLKRRPGKVLSPTNSTWFGSGVMQMELGAPIIAASRSPVGVFPFTGLLPGGTGTSMVNIRRKRPSVSKT